MSEKNGNFIPNEVMSNMPTKKLLEKWAGYLVDKAKYSLFKYHMNDGDSGSKAFVRMLFEDTIDYVNKIIPVLEDLVAENIFGLEGVVAATYGKSSDEAYVADSFIGLYRIIERWDEYNMWKNCPNDRRLAEILRKFCPRSEVE